ncbi:hypothetical protein [Curtobacterium sp. MCBD17_040]|uniref:hypothetical protein n=1 Tax=Curtobacterium sp. MCBD17_040 TaxID=2175674 RepID=UPI000DAACA94|nr:hypothetical protein [Curtobacterium sp. MCBD17_040]WIB65378.1 hypothetical protein DEI94_18395 [Curtobacterium sp. MCBD17_040]
MTVTATLPSIHADWVALAARQAATAAANRDHDSCGLQRMPFDDLPEERRTEYLLDAQDAVIAALPILWEAARTAAVSAATATFAAHAAGHPVVAGMTAQDAVLARLNAVLGDEPVITG